MIVAPIFYNQTTLGVIKAYSAEPDRFNETHADTLNLITNVLAAALGRAYEFEEKLVAKNQAEEAAWRSLNSSRTCLTRFERRSTGSWE